MTQWVVVGALAIGLSVGVGCSEPPREVEPLAFDGGPPRESQVGGRRAPPPVVDSDPDPDPDPDGASPESLDGGASRPEPDRRELGELLASLREVKLGAAAAVLEKRVAQESPKYKLTEEQARVTARYLLDDMPRMPASKKLLGHLPRTTVELLRAVHEREVPAEEAEAIAGYLTRVVLAMRFDNLQGVDVSQSHVIGREWHQIDYSGEPLTWQSQKAAWEPLGVRSFKRLEYVQTYFQQVSRMKFFKRVYRPAGQLPPS